MSGRTLRIASVMLIGMAWTGLVAASEPAESLRFDPTGFRHYDLADRDALEDIRDDTPDGLIPLVPAAMPGVTTRFLLPKKYPKDGIAQIVVESWPDDAISTATVMLRARGASIEASCPGATTRVVGEREEFGFRAALSLTHCAKDATTGLGRVLLTKLILGGDRVHSIEVAYHYPAFAPGSTPLLRSQMDEAIRLLATSKVCYGRGDGDCSIRARHLIEATPRQLTAEQSAEIARIETLGGLLYRHDQIAWHGTDALRDRGIDLAGLQAAGWVTRITAGEPDRLIYVGRQEGVAVGLVQVSYDGEPPSVTDLKHGPLTGDSMAAFKALDLTRNERMLSCSNTRNMVSFPDPAGQGWLVYWMSATDQPDMMLSGGHTRFLVSPDGSAILGRLAMTKSCLTMPLKGGPTGQDLASVSVTHLVTDLPTEVHVFNSLLHKVPILVFAPGGTWRATAGKLERIY
jgi:hypothetical protein